MTTTGQRIGIWVIAIAMTVGTVAGFVAMIVGSQNQADLQKLENKFNAEYTKYQTDVAAQQKSLDDKASALSKKYYATLLSYKSSYVKKFDASSVKKVESTTLKSGSGRQIGGVTTYAAYYVGWTSDGKIFDSSFDKKKLKSPFIIRPSGVIPGWEDGMQGKKIGGVYILTIPAKDAYGEQGSGDIKPNSPLKFIVMPIQRLETLTEPQIPAELAQSYYGQQ